LDIVGYDLRDLPNESVEWLWHGYIGKGLLTLLASPPKSGKSTMLWHLIATMQKGEPFLEHRTHSVGTTIFTEEATATLSQRRDLFGIGDRPIHAVQLQPGITWPKVVLYAKERITRHGDSLLIFDTISRFWGAQDENDAAEQIRLIGPLFALVRHYGVAAVLVHHTRKHRGWEGRGVRGSNALPGAVDIILEFGRLSPADTSSTRRRLDGLSRFSETPQTLIADLRGGTYVVNDEVELTREPDIIRLVSETEECTASRLADELGLSERQVQRVLSGMVNRGVLERTGAGSGSSPFVYQLGTDG
jgi:hypothetical protein